MKCYSKAVAQLRSHWSKHIPKSEKVTWNINKSVRFNIWPCEKACTVYYQHQLQGFLLVVKGIKSPFRAKYSMSRMMVCEMQNLPQMQVSLSRTMKVKGLNRQWYEQTFLFIYLCLPTQSYIQYTAHYSENAVVVFINMESKHMLVRAQGLNVKGFLCVFDFELKFTITLISNSLN